MSLETVLRIEDAGQLWSGVRSRVWQLSSGVGASFHCASSPFPSNSEEKGLLERTHAQSPSQGPDPFCIALQRTCFGTRQAKD